MATFIIDGLTMPDGNNFDIPLFVAEYGTTTFAEVQEAYLMGKMVVVYNPENGNVFTMESANTDEEYEFTHLDYGQVKTLSVNYIDNWWENSNGYYVDDMQRVSNLVTSISASSTNRQYPSAKCVYDIVGNIEALLAAI